jgi:hypothetical protein
MQFLIVLLFAILVFGACFAVLAFKSRKSEAPRLHACGGHEEECQCRTSPNLRCSAHPPFDLADTLEKARKIDSPEV